MPEIKHTPGPWRFMTDTTGQYLAVFAQQGGTKVICPVKIADAGHAHLIAAAPDLLEALRETIEDLEARWDMNDPRTNPGIRQCVERGRAAIAKAEGSTHA